MVPEPPGEDPNDLARAAECVIELTEVYDDELAPLFKDMATLRDALKQTRGHREELRAKAGLKSQDLDTISVMLKTLRGYNVANTGGRGDPWKYTGKK